MSVEQCINTINGNVDAITSLQNALCDIIMSGIPGMIPVDDRFTK